MRIWPYSNSKLAITLFTMELARRVKKLGITVNAVDPGIVNTGIIRMQMFFDPLTDLVFRPIIRTPLQGADTAIHLLLDNDVQGQTGTFNRSRKIINLGKKYTEHPKMQELWERTEKIVQPFMA
jgi:NAD(P)-dependent dehydrogenase (short-subunit alcohol dehydrogenase family)